MLHNDIDDFDKSIYVQNLVDIRRHSSYVRKTYSSGYNLYSTWLSLRAKEAIIEASFQLS